MSTKMKLPERDCARDRLQQAMDDTGACNSDVASMPLYTKELARIRSNAKLTRFLNQPAGHQVWLLLMYIAASGYDGNSNDFLRVSTGIEQSRRDLHQNMFSVVAIHVVIT